MEPITSIRPLLAILVSAAGALLIIAAGRRPNLRELCSVVTGVVKLAIIASMLPTVLAGRTIECTLFRLLPGLSLELRVDALGLLFALGASALWIVTTFYSIGYMRSLDEHAQTRYYACFAVALSSTIGVAFSANLLTMFLFYEALTLVTFPLVAHKGTSEAMVGARKYLIYLLGAAKALLLPAIILTFNLAGTLQFTAGGIFPESALLEHPRLLTVVYLLFLFGLAKCALMPLHSWLPAAMVAPTPVSALLHAVAVVKTGVFAVLRVILFVFGTGCLASLGLDTLTIALAGLTVLLASLIALTRDNLKALLAFSTISQLSYILLGAALLTPSGLVGGIAHITNHAIAKITLFFCAGSIYVSSKRTEISQMAGIGRRMPWTMAAFAVATLSMIGVPPSAGFVSKWYLLLGSMERRDVASILVLLVSALLNAAYFVPVVVTAFFGEHAAGDAEAQPVRERPMIVVPLVLTAVASLVLGLCPDIVVHIARLVVP